MTVVMLVMMLMLMMFIFSVLVWLMGFPVCACCIGQPDHNQANDSDQRVECKTLGNVIVERAIGNAAIEKEPQPDE